MATIRYYTEKYIQAIADAIRAKNGKTRKYKTREMGPAILEMVTYLGHLRQMSAWWIHSCSNLNRRPPDFSLDDEEAGYAVFDATSHYVLPAVISKHPRIRLKIDSGNGEWKIYPVLYTDPVSSGTGGMSGNVSNIGVYPMTHLNTMPYSTDENYNGLNYGEFGDYRNLSTAYDNSIFSKGSTYIWNVDTTGTHPTVLEKLDDTNSGVISFSNFSRDFLFTDLVGVPRRLDGLIENVIIYASSGFNDPLVTYTPLTYFGVFFHTGEEKVYYDTSDGKLKSASTMKSYKAPAQYGTGIINGICDFNPDQGVWMYYGKLDVSETDSATVFAATCSQENVAKLIPFRTYDIKDQNGNTIAAKNCNVEDFGIEPKEE